MPNREEERKSESNMTTKNDPNRQPQIPVPSTLGGGLMTVFRCGGPKPGNCTSPNCHAHAVAKCKFKLTDRSGNPSGLTCGNDICKKHTGKRGFCLAHERLTDQIAGFVRMVP